MEKNKQPEDRFWPTRFLLATAGLLAFLPSCSSQPGVYQEPGILHLARGIEASETPRSVQPDLKEPEGTLTLREALSLTLLGNAELSAFSWEIRASEARALQAGLQPNPTFEGEIEDFAGSGDFSRFNEAESTIALSQLIELGGKRAKRLRVAELGRGLATWDYEARRLRILTETAQAFVGVLAGQRRVELQTASLGLAREVLHTVSERVDAGKSSPIETTRAQIVVSQSGILLERANRTLEAARAGLAASWGGTSARFQSVIGALEETPAVPALDTLAVWIVENPDISRWSVEIAERQARIELAEAQAIPDVTVNAGARLLQGTDETAFVVGLSVPLPLYDRNQGRRSEAVFNLAKANEQRRAVELRIRTALSDEYQSLLSAFREVETLRDEVLPAARSAFDGISEAYRQGKLTQLDVLDSQRTLFEVREQFTEALSSYHRARARVEGLVGRSIENIDKGGPR